MPTATRLQHNQITALSLSPLRLLLLGWINLIVVRLLVSSSLYQYDESFFLRLDCNDAASFEKAVSHKSTPQGSRCMYSDHEKWRGFLAGLSQTPGLMGVSWMGWMADTPAIKSFLRPKWMNPPELVRVKT